MSAQKTLTPWAVQPLDVGVILPTGWLLQEMKTMGDGLAGHMYDFYRYVQNSTWLHPQGSDKGEDYSRLNEALPYWFNGLVPLAYQLDDARLKDQVGDIARRVLSFQAEDGWLGPEVVGNRNFWGRTPFVLGLMQLVEADPTWEQQVIDSLRRYFALMNAMLHDNATGFVNGPEPSWGQARVFDTILTIHWLLERAPSEQDELLWDNIKLLDSLNTVRWEEWYGSDGYPKVVKDPQVESKEFPFLHGVNVAQGLKGSAVAWRFRPSDKVQHELALAMKLTMDHHSAPSGTMLADELQKNLAPWMGSELCMAVEMGYSMAYTYLSLGLNEYADRAETVIFNALPAAFTDDYWAHQYMTQPNQPWAKFNHHDYDESQPKLFTTAQSGVATVFGLEPQYPCCTVNFPQGWPKFVSHSWGRFGSSSLAHVLLGPSKVTMLIAGKEVTASCETLYPFDNVLQYRLESPVDFDFYIRVPTWYIPNETRISLNNSPATPVKPDSTSGLHRIKLPAGTSTVKFSIGIPTRIETRSNKAVSIYRGNLLYALEIGSTSTSQPARPFDNARGPPLPNTHHKSVRDHFLSNTTPWNTAIDPKSLKFSGPGNVASDSRVFSPDADGPAFTVQGCEVEWPLYLDTTPDWPPVKPKCIGEPTEFRLVPYGSAKLHMSELPVIDLENI